MDISIFDVIGPIMIGPSSSHTAGAAKLARIARIISGDNIKKVSFGLHGSFAQTYKGHGTDKALVAGALGMNEDDENINNSFEIAKNKGFEYEIYEIQLYGVHENTVKMTFEMQDGAKNVIIGSSIGGGEIMISNINGFETEFNAKTPILLIRQKDLPGVVSEVTKILAKDNINIGVMKLSRKEKGSDAFCAIETDNEISNKVVEDIRCVANIISVQALNIS